MEKALNLPWQANVMHMVNSYPELAVRALPDDTRKKALNMLQETLQELKDNPNPNISETDQQRTSAEYDKAIRRLKKIQHDKLHGTSLNTNDIQPPGATVAVARTPDPPVRG
jgi:lipopolysaccharide biosynthesis regulator YciM